MLVFLLFDFAHDFSFQSERDQISVNVGRKNCIFISDLKLGLKLLLIQITQIKQVGIENEQMLASYSFSIMSV